MCARSSPPPAASSPPSCSPRPRAPTSGRSPARAETSAISYCRADTDNRVTLVRQRSSTRCRLVGQLGLRRPRRVGRPRVRGRVQGRPWAAAAATRPPSPAPPLPASRSPRPSPPTGKATTTTTCPRGPSARSRATTRWSATDVEVTIQPGGSVTGFAGGRPSPAAGRGRPAAGRPASGSASSVGQRVHGRSTNSGREGHRIYFRRSSGRSARVRSGDAAGPGVSSP